MRRNMSAKRHAGKFNKMKRRGRKINNPTRIMRGGFRL